MTAGSTTTIKFNDPKVVAAIELFGSIAKDDKKVAGGVKAVATTDFRDSPNGLFAVPPACYMHRQASFIPSFFPEGTVLGRRRLLLLPGLRRQAISASPCSAPATSPPSPRTSPAARAFIDFLKTPIANEIWMAQSGLPVGHEGRQRRRPTATTRCKDEGQILLNATTFRFDGSDLMPGADRRRRVLDRHGRLRQRQVRPGSGRRHPGRWDAIK